MASTKNVRSSKKGPGRPPLYPLTPKQVARVENLINSGYTSRQVEERTGFHEFAILRVRRAM